MEKINLKRLLALTAILTIVAPSSIGILANVQINTSINDISAQEIVNEINNQNYTKKVVVKTSATDLEKTITAEFIGEELSDSIKTAFNSELFKFNKITIDDQQLQDDDLLEEATIVGKINYDYGEILNQNTNLTINVVVTEQEVVTAINEKDYYIETAIETPVEDINKLITGQFIGEELSTSIKNAFDPELFKFNKITIDDIELTDHDLANEDEIEAKINYDYGEILKQNTNLTINVVVTEQEVVTAINNQIYNIKTKTGSSVERINNLITAEFISEKLSTSIKNTFDSELFKFNKITIDDIELTDHDLANEGQIEAKINYDYGTIKEQITSLKINITKSFNLGEVALEDYSIYFNEGITIEQLKNDFLNELLKDEDFIEVMSEEIEDQEIITDLNNYILEEIYWTDKTTPAKDNNTETVSLLDAKINGKNQLSGTIYIRIKFQ